LIQLDFGRKQSFENCGIVQNSPKKVKRDAAEPEYDFDYDDDLGENENTTDEPLKPYYESKEDEEDYGEINAVGFIRNGIKVPDYTHPWNAALVEKTVEGLIIFCGATIISNTALVTG
jgi:hypothetical protein